MDQIIIDIGYAVGGAIAASGTIKAWILWFNKVLDKMEPVIAQLDKIKAEVPQALVGINCAEKLIEDARTATEDGQVTLLEGIGLLHDVEDVLEQAKPIYAALKAMQSWAAIPVVTVNAVPAPAVPQ